TRGYPALSIKGGWRGGSLHGTCSFSPSPSAFDGKGARGRGGLLTRAPSLSLCRGSCLCLGLGLFSAPRLRLCGVFAFDLLEEVENARALSDGGIEAELDLGCDAQIGPVTEFPADKASGAAQSLERFLLLLRAPEDRYVDACVPQIRRDVGIRHRDEP